MLHKELIDPHSIQINSPSLQRQTSKNNLLLSSQQQQQQQQHNLHFQQTVFQNFDSACNDSNLNSQIGPSVANSDIMCLSERNSGSRKQEALIQQLIQNKFPG